MDDWTIATPTRVTIEASGRDGISLVTVEMDVGQTSSPYRPTKLRYAMEWDASDAMTMTPKDLVSDTATRLLRELSGGLAPKRPEPPAPGAPPE